MTVVARQPRSYLYVPGDREDRLAKAAQRGADALILDLEDGVAVTQKDAARECVARFLSQAPPGPQWWVRVNGDRLAEDIAAVVRPGITGLVVPGADPDRLQQVDGLVSQAEAAAGMPAGSVPVIALLETARAVLQVAQVASGPRVVRLGLGEADLAGELGIQPDAERRELWPIRSTVVLASAATGLAAPIGPVETTLRDPERLAATSRILLRQGFRARTAIHPEQLSVIHAVFTPTTEEVARAREVIERWEAAERAGSGVAVGPGGQMLDAAVIRSAREVLSRAE
ncbi:MAG TPA: CoA ester lyase [Natronosporangium sp.]|nr:CoA ester lyase [Natronosporangium sp.]